MKKRKVLSQGEIVSGDDRATGSVLEARKLGLIFISTSTRGQSPGRKPHRPLLWTVNDQYLDPEMVFLWTRERWAASCCWSGYLPKGLRWRRYYNQRKPRTRVMVKIVM